MVRAAIENEPGFVLDAREFDREGPSYTVDTLQSIREENTDVPLCLLMGMDAFLGLTEWHRWTELFSLAHIVAAHRPGWQVSAEGELGKVLSERNTNEISELHASLCGRIYVTPVTQLEISATDLRDGINAGFDPRFLVPENVRQMLLESEIYAKER